MTARDYPVTFPFGATTSPYSPAHPHLGADRAMPIGTAVDIAGTIIGRSGETGDADGPHTHQAKWKSGQLAGGIYVSEYNATYFDPADVLDTPGTVSNTGYNSVAGNFVRWVGADGYTREVFHMNEANVTIGQKIGDDMQEQIDELNKQLNQTNIYLGEAQAAITELNKQLNSTNGYVDKLDGRVTKIEQAGTQSCDGTYTLKKVK